VTTVLVTRPAPDNAATAAALRGHGIDAVLAPVLRCEPLAFADDGEVFAGVIATSANALRALAAHPMLPRLVALPLFTVGAHSAEAARAAGFTEVISADAATTRKAASLAGKVDRRLGATAAPLLYVAGAEVSHDIAADLAARGRACVTRIAYRMAPLRHLPAEAASALAGGRIDAVLHYSRRSAETFVAAARDDALEISALALPQCCLSDNVAAVLREAGAGRIQVATTPDEEAMIAAVRRSCGLAA
jgi:uroporphyrinogen-III synthase